MHDGGSGMGPGLSFAQEMVRMAPSIRIGLAPCAVGGSPLKRWEKGGDLYARALERAQAARKGGTLKGLLWHQGETDSNNASDASSYQDRLVKMLTDFREDLGLPDLPVVVGQLGDFVDAPKAQTVRNALVTMPGQLAHVAFVDSTGLMDKGDRLHFNAAAAREFGIRYALVMRTLQGDAR
ncbi:MAG TPA: sialate O-acetylesterase, partial [Roseimicrobium sp.]|nr:sialate O-acetylesterase [Roseimicrobium sp.]